MKSVKHVIALAALCAVSGAALAQKAHMATNWMAPVHILNDVTYQQWAADVAKASNGTLKFEVHSNGSLVPARSTMQGIRDSVAVVGIVYPAYTPAEFPLNNVVNDLVFVSDDDIAAAFAYTELAMTHPKLQAEWKKNGGVFGGGYSTPVYNFICGKAIRKLDDTKGLKIRTAGGAQSEWVKAIGAVPVSVPSPDIYSGIERGSIDCSMSDPSMLDKGAKLWEVAKSVTLLPMGVVVGANYIYNPDFWKGLKPSERKMLLDTMARATARAQVAYHKSVQEALDGARKRGLELVEPSADLKARLATYNKQTIDNLPKASMESRKIADPTDLIKAYLELETKWKGLLKGVDRNSDDAVYKVLHDNLYSKLDPAKFGL
ncbi:MULTISPECIES: C4-dicarboxylate TRAP transporter substrate-binding protein [Hydrogenophaga]|uniref:C4-dicarboxylate TRAP transporter substrate-binding protein n=2 Tax=Hydrogenophaga TaxID=47420 RepID=A0ABW2QPP3_9BURK